MTSTGVDRFLLIFLPFVRRKRKKENVHRDRTIIDFSLFSFLYRAEVDLISFSSERNDSVRRLVFSPLTRIIDFFFRIFPRCKQNELLNI